MESAFVLLSPGPLASKQRCTTGAAVARPKRRTAITRTALRATMKTTTDEDLRPTQEIRTSPTVKRLNRATKWIVSGGVLVALIVRRDADTVLLVAGSFLTGVLGKLLKFLINERRPDGAKKADPGMPSSHAIQLAYYAAYLSSAIATGTMDPIHKLASCLALCWLAATSISWRVLAGLHTTAQVLVGSALGVLGAVAWRYVCVNALFDPVNALVLANRDLLTIGAVGLGLLTVSLGPFLRVLYKRGGDPDA